MLRISDDKKEHIVHKNLQLLLYGDGSIDRPKMGRL